MLSSSKLGNYLSQGNLLMGIDKKTVRQEGDSLLTYVLFSVTNFLYGIKMV